MSETFDLACWLCERPLETRIQWHHPIPKSKKGRVTVPIHPICHKAIHANFTNGELARMGADLGVIRAHPEIAKFIRWISSKPPDFHAPTRK
ncbi:HNH endonuclease [Altererythrobacter sp.]|uniref:HNH endonuclease n=1 Tax=Altererythrobacter sp. TaxID=1872480 RepID=UPI001B155BB3|nr:HNH endonuclease [Altererythrobacter sp.]MBO6944059.1 HNH endonuclease [Altererythrobacter sp.]